MQKKIVCEYTYCIMNMKKIVKNKTWQLLGTIVLIVAGLYVYRDVLPRFFPLQHTVSPATIGDGEYDPREVLAIYHGQKTVSHKMPDVEINENVLGENDASKRIEIDLTNQRLYAYEDGRMVYNFVISSGLYDWTPRGTFWTWIKLRYAKMEGGSQALGNYYYLPNVPYIMYFQNNEIPGSRGFGIHGTYWHNDFGRPKSHGCINLRTEDAGQLFEWAPLGISINIYGRYVG